MGRRRDLALLDDHLAGEGPPVLFLAGEPGIGKTRLLQAAATRGAGQGLRVLQDGCGRRGHQVPYAPILGALQRHIHTQTPDQRQRDLRGCAWLVRLLPELADQGIEPLPPWSVSPAHERRLLFEAVAHFLRNVAGSAGALLLLDDLQWAGSDGLDLLAMLARSAADVPLRVIGAYRDTEVQQQDALSVMLADLAQAGQATRRLLNPLASLEAAQLLDELWVTRDEPDSALRERVLQRAGGVPFFLISLAQAGGQAAHEDAGTEAPPWDVEQSVRQRVAALSSVARELLGVAAVIGRVVSHTLLIEVTARAEDEIVAALDHAFQARLLEERGEQSYQFVHDIIREVVEADIGAARRPVLHRRIAQALEHAAALPGVDLLAYHYARSDAPDQAILYLEQAADRARAQSAHTAAEAYYRDLSERLDRRGAVLHGAQVREKLGLTLAAAARYAGALAALEQAAATYDAEMDQERVLGALAAIGRVHAASDTPHKGLARLQPLLHVLEAGAPSSGAVALASALAWLFLACGRHHDSIAMATLAAEQAQALGDTKALADVQARHARALFELGEVEAALQAAERALPLVAAAGHHDALSRLWNNLGDAHKVRGAFSLSQVCRERAFEVAQRSHDPLGSQWALAGLGEVLFLRGDWETARVRLEQAAEVERSVGWSLGSHFRLYAVAALHLAEGRWDEVARCLETSVTRAGRLQPTYYGLDPQRLLAERDLLIGDPERARARLVDLPDHPRKARSVEEPALGALLAWAHLDVGDVAQAGDVVAQAIEQARAMSHHLYLVDALRVQALVATRQEHWAAAQRAPEEGLVLTRTMPYPYAEARIREAYGAFHLARGERMRACTELQAAVRLFRILGATVPAQRVEHVLLALSPVFQLFDGSNS